MICPDIRAKHASAKKWLGANRTDSGVNILAKCDVKFSLSLTKLWTEQMYEPCNFTQWTNLYKSDIQFFSEGNIPSMAWFHSFYW